LQIEKEKAESESQIDWFERKNINTKKKNRYPNINYEEALIYDQRFAEHLA
jgi:hypothetical protein